MFYETEELTKKQIDDFFATTPRIDNQIKALITSAVEWTLKRPELVLVTLLEKMKRGQTPEHPEGPLFRRMITEAFKRGQIAGVITKNRRPQELASDIDGLYMVHMVRWYHYGQKDDLLSAILSAVNTYLSGALIKSEKKILKEEVGK